MDRARVKQISYEAKQWAKSHGFESDAEDMAQHVLFRLSQNRQARVDQICIDYVRSVYGRTGTRGYKNQKSKSIEKRFYTELNDEDHGVEMNYDVNMEQMDFSVFQNYLESKERAMVTLKFKWGMTGSEIADCFGISEGCVSLKLKEIREKLLAQIVQQSE